jgi:GxxExxY protein
MNTEEHGIRDPLTHLVIGTFFEVHKELGYGFLESVYRRALVLALVDRGLWVEAEAPIPVLFRERPVGDYRADLLVERRLIVEVKAGESLAPSHRAQLLNYLRATAVEVGLLVNFGAKLSFERFLFTNDRKKSMART